MALEVGAAWRFEDDEHDDEACRTPIVHVRPLSYVRMHINVCVQRALLTVLIAPPMFCHWLCLALVLATYTTPHNIACSRPFSS